MVFTPFRIFTPSPILGYGYDLKEFWATIEQSRPSAIILDAGSTDPGPHLLGTGKLLCSRQSYLRDLSPILEACSKYAIKLLISSAGGAGTNEQVDKTVDIIRELADRLKHEFKLSTIKFEDDRDAFTRKLREGSVYPCSSSPPLMEADLTECKVVVAQMGAEPFRRCLEQEDPDIIVAGRSYDPSPFAAFCMHHGVEESTAWHVGKIIECGGLCTVPKGRSIIATMFEDSFYLTPTDAKQRCTPLSVAAHTLYEKTRPDRLPGPGGVLHLDACTYVPLRDGRSVLIKGAQFVPTPRYQLKLEGAKHVGFRTTYIGGIRDPILIRGIHEFLDVVVKTTQDAVPNVNLTEDGPRLIFHLYGINAVMGGMESHKGVPHEIGLLGEVVAETQELADSIASFSRTVVLHGSYRDQVATAGNLASPLTPLESSLGPVFRFSVYHLVDWEDPLSLFPIYSMSIGQIEHGRQLGKEQSSAVTDSRGNLGSDPLGLITGLNDQRENEDTSPASRESRAPSMKASPWPALKLSDLARVIRSKNAGPFEITLDILFETRDAYRHVKSSNVLSATLIKELYHLKSISDVVICMFFEPALAWKCTIKRYQAQGSVGETDTFGAQMHAPLLDIAIPAATNVAASRWRL